MFVLFAIFSDATSKGTWVIFMSITLEVALDKAALTLIGNWIQYFSVKSAAHKVWLTKEQFNSRRLVFVWFVFHWVKLQIILSFNSSQCQTVSIYYLGEIFPGVGPSKWCTTLYFTSTWKIVMPPRLRWLWPEAICLRLSVRPPVHLAARSRRIAATLWAVQMWQKYPLGLKEELIRF